MKKPQAISRRRPARTLLLQASGLALLAALAAAAGHARAEDGKPAAPIVEENARAMQQMEEDEHQLYTAAPPPLRVGDATDTLFALQRSGELASATPRPIAGPVAHRSYERYLKSFEHAIPEYLNSSVKKTPGEAGR